MLSGSIHSVRSFVTWGSSLLLLVGTPRVYPHAHKAPNATAQPQRKKMRKKRKKLTKLTKLTKLRNREGEGGEREKDRR